MHVCSTPCLVAAAVSRFSSQLKILKQRIRDHVRPEQNLGHSDADANKMKNKVKGQEEERQVKEEMEEKQAE